MYSHLLRNWVDQDPDLIGYNSKNGGRIIGGNCRKSNEIVNGIIPSSLERKPVDIPIDRRRI